MSRYNNPFPNGPVRKHPRASVLTLHRRQIKADVRRQIKRMRAEHAKPVMARVLPNTLLGLRAEAKAVGLKGYSKMSKAELQEVLS